MSRRLRGSRREDAAKKVIDGLHTKLGEFLSDLAAAEKYLTDDPDGPSRVATLIDFVVLHHARSLVVPLRHIFDGRRSGRRGQDIRADRAALARTRIAGTTPAGSAYSSTPTTPCRWVQCRCWISRTGAADATASLRSSCRCRPM